MMLYTWKDIERELLLNKGKWQGVISNTEVYIDEVIIHLNENSKIPEILLTMVQNGMNTAEIISELSAVYHPNIMEGDDSIMDDIVTELPFASELVHLETLPKIMVNLSGRDFYKNISEIVKNSYMVSKETKRCMLKIPRKRHQEKSQIPEGTQAGKKADSQDINSTALCRRKTHLSLKPWNEGYIRKFNKKLHKILRLGWKEHERAPGNYGAHFEEVLLSQIEEYRRNGINEIKLKLTVNEMLHTLNIRHIEPDTADTYKPILDISLVYLKRG